ncbi:hypothetical protein Ait01nite_003490 [Actinoplanes italicus]|nr:hypothetical protein Ait01nite_003490 [Actinoplanes italicus]
MPAPDRRPSGRRAADGPRDLSGAVAAEMGMPWHEPPQAAEESGAAQLPAARFLGQVRRENSLAQRWARSARRFLRYRSDGRTGDGERHPVRLRPARTGGGWAAVQVDGWSLIQERKRSYRSSGGEWPPTVKSSRASYIWADR